MKGFIKTWFQRIWGKVSVDNLVVCQRCRSLWSTCTSNALPHRSRNRYHAVTRKEESWRLDPVQRRSCPGLRCLKVFLWTPRRFLCSSFVRSCNHRFSSVSCTKLFWSLELPTVDATTFARCLTCQGKRCTCRSGWSKHCLEFVTLYRDRGICSSKDACASSSWNVHSVNLCDHAEMYVQAISVLNNSATPALFVSILSKLELPMRFSLSHKWPCHGSSVCHQAFWFLE